MNHETNLFLKLNNLINKMHYSTIIFSLILITVLSGSLFLNSELKKTSKSVEVFAIDQIHNLQNKDHVKFTEELHIFYIKHSIRSIALIDPSGVMLANIGSVIHNYPKNTDGLNHIYIDGAIDFVYSKKIFSEHGEVLGTIMANFNIIEILIPFLVRLCMTLLMTLIAVLIIKYITNKGIVKLNLLLKETVDDFRKKNETYSNHKQAELESLLSTNDQHITCLKSVLKLVDIVKDNPLQLNLARKEVERTIKIFENTNSALQDLIKEIKLNTAPQSIVNIIVFAVSHLSQAYKSSNIKFSYNILNKNEPIVDKEQIAKALTNLIEDAIENITVIGSKEDGHIWINTNNREGLFELVIGSNGTSFEEEEVSQVSKLFFNNNKPRKTGLGITLVEKIIHLHGGELKARNVTDGVEFIITLPSSKKVESLTTEMLPKSIQEINFVNA